MGVDATGRMEGGGGGEDATGRSRRRKGVDAIKRKEGRGVIGRKVEGKMRGSKRRRRGGGGRKRREEEDGWMKEDRKSLRERRRRRRGKIERKAVNMNGLERYAILSKGTAVCVPDN